MRINHWVLGMLMFAMIGVPAWAEDTAPVDSSTETTTAAEPVVKMQPSGVRDDWREIRQDRKELYGDRRELRHDLGELQADRQAGDGEEFREDSQELREDRAEYRGDRREFRDDKRDFRQEIRDSLTDEEKAKIKELHEQYPNMNRRQLYRAVKNPEKFQKRQEWLSNYKNEHPNATPDEIRLAARQERYDKILQKIKEKHPDATDEQINQALEKRKEARQERWTKNHPYKAERVKEFKENHPARPEASRLETRAGDAIPGEIRKAVNHPAKARPYQQGR